MSLLELHAPKNTARNTGYINRKRHTDSNPWMTRLQINLIAHTCMSNVSLNVFPIE
jgi:hypothetical protein